MGVVSGSASPILSAKAVQRATKWASAARSCWAAWEARGMTPRRVARLRVLCGRATGGVGVGRVRTREAAACRRRRPALPVTAVYVTVVAPGIAWLAGVESGGVVMPVICVGVTTTGGTTLGSAGCAIVGVCSTTLGGGTLSGRSGGISAKPGGGSSGVIGATADVGGAVAAVEKISARRVSASRW